MQTSDRIIRTKLHPPFTRRSCVDRSRLDAYLAEGLRGPLTLLTAPAGFGKTTLLTHYFSRHSMPVAWLSLDKQDNQPGRFLKYVVSAIHQQQAQVGQQALHMLDSMQPASYVAVLTSLINALDATDADQALVLDDYQLITNKDIHAQVAFLLEHCPTTLHLVIASRSDPPLPLARFRARGQMIELRAADLRFTHAEIADFLNDVMALNLNAHSLTVLGERTEGWIAGLQMAALSLQGQDAIQKEYLIRKFAGTHRFIMDYLLEEVLAREPAHIRDFLVQTAILNRLHGPLCDAVTRGTNGKQVLEDLERRNLFIATLDEERHWYRYHHLFADLLLSHLHQSPSEHTAQLYARASLWCEDNDLVHDAISYAFSANDAQRTAHLIATHWGQALQEGEIETVWEWLNALPAAALRQNAVLNVAYCWVLWFRGEINKVEKHLPYAEQALREQDSKHGHATKADDDDQLPAQIAALHAIVARYNNAFDDAILFAQKALALIPDNLPPELDARLRTPSNLALATAYDGAGQLEQAITAYQETIRWSRLAQDVAGIAGITYRLAIVLRLLGRLHEAESACRAALAYLQEQNMDRLPVAGIVNVALAEVLVERNNLTAAEKHIALAQNIGKWDGRLDAVRNAAEAHSRLLMAQSNPDGALDAIQSAESTLGDPPSPLAWAEILALRANVYTRQGALSQAVLCIEKAKDLAGWDQGLTGERINLAECRFRLAQEHSAGALLWVTAKLNASEQHHRYGAVIEYRVLRSLAHSQRGDIQAALTDLDQALNLAHAEGYVRVFLDEGQTAQTLLAQWLAQADTGPARDYASTLFAQFSGAKPEVEIAPNDQLIEPLTARELDVLRLMALGHTNKEIGQQLFVAPGTVKAHSSRIYQKLYVANRTAAVARARELHILP